MLLPDELTAVLAHFGVAEQQVRRDHAISVLLAALSDSPAADRVVFFGGTALSRTHLPDVRLSEDIDLLAVGSRSEAIRAVMQAWAAPMVRRELGAEIDCVPADDWQVALGQQTRIAVDPAVAARRVSAARQAVRR